VLQGFLEIGYPATHLIQPTNIGRTQHTVDLPQDSVDERVGILEVLLAELEPLLLWLGLRLGFWFCDGLGLSPESEEFVDLAFRDLA
jgi:hypothetical protein